MKRFIVLLASVGRVSLAASFDSGQAGWKLDADGKIEMKDGKPVWRDANGGEQALAGDTVSRLNGEARQLRLRAETAETALAPYKDIDPAKARDALDKIGKIDQKTLIDAGEVEKVRDEISKGFTAQVQERDKRIAEQEQRIVGMTIDTAFATSKYIGENIDTPMDLFKPAFAKNFKYEDGKLVPYDNLGNKVFSKDRMGEVANFDEAVAQLVESSPYKDKMLKAQQASGTGNGGGGGNRGGGRVMKRSDYDRLDPNQQMQAGMAVSKGEMSIVD